MATSRYAERASASSRCKISMRRSISEIRSRPADVATTGERHMAGERHAPSIDQAEIERFSRHAADWWDPRGPMARAA